MPEYLAPGVYIEELSTGPVPIEGVSTSTAGFVGQTERGPVQPTLVTSFVEYQRWFGGFLDPSVSYLPFAAKGFFDNGGQRLFIARVVGAGATPAILDLGTIGGPSAGPRVQNLQLTAIGPGQWGIRIFARVGPSTLTTPAAGAGASPTPVGFRLTLVYYQAPLPPNALTTNGALKVDPLRGNLTDPDRVEPTAVEDYDPLRTVQNSQDFPPTVINSGSQQIQVQVNGQLNLQLDGNNFTAFTPLAGAAPGATTLTFNDYVGNTGPGQTVPPDVHQRVGLAGLETINEISLLCVPDEVKSEITGANQITDEIVNQCLRLRYRFGILHVVPPHEADVEAIRPPRDTSYAAIYYPFVRVLNPVTLDYPLIPSGGHVAGIYAATDIDRGVHKAPANVEVAGIVTRDIDTQRKALEFLLTKGQQDILNPRGVNVIRDFRPDGRGIRVWGARTMSTDTQWKYVNVRRLFIFVEQSIDRGTQWVVFEPNDEPTWARVRRSITNFLITVWRNGALMGTTQDEAFFVKCDRTTMTQDDIDNGRLICYVGIAPVKPAEFVIFRISQKTIEATQ
jgi:phage tail sheath protein FI